MMEVERKLDTELNCNELCTVEEMKEASNDTEIRRCKEADVMDVCNELVTSVDGNKTGDELDIMQLDCSAENQTNENLKTNGLHPWLENHMEEIVHNTALKPCSLQDKEVENSIELAKKVQEDKEIEPYEIVNVGDLCAANHALDVFSNSNTEPCAISKVKEASNEDMYSEVSNPNPSPNGTSNLTISSQVVDLLGVDHGGCGEITSAYSKKIEPVSTSCVVLEIPKHVSTTGITKITFKFSKRKEEYANEIPVVAKHAVDYNFHEGYYENPVSVDGDHPLTRAHQELSSYRDVEMNLSVNCSELNESSSPLSHFPHRELNTSKKISAADYPNNVKKLLATRILDGARVKYISKSREKELQGIIKDGGYLCGCFRCNFSKVVSAYEFELHAGTNTRHPNNHIFLENGKSVYKIIEEVKTAPLNTKDDVIKSVAGSSINEEYFQVWRANLASGNALAFVDALHLSKHSGTYSSSVGYISHPTEDSPYPASCHYSQFIPAGQQSYLETSTERKRLVKKPRNACSSSSWEHKKASEGGTKKRDNDLHKMLFMPNGLPDGTELAYYAKGKKVLGGYKQRNGILCSCCDTEISPSQFEAHAGWAARRQPYRHIYTSSGLALHDIALMLANGQKLMTSGHDDMCAVCGDGKELITCHRCPRAFHAACLGLKCLPEDDWCCAHCRDKFGAGGKASGALKPIMMRFSRASKAPEFETGGCVICRSQEFSAATFDDKTVILCDQCEKEYHVGCLRESGMCDLKELPEDKWFCCGDCNKIFVTLQNLASGRAEVVPSSVSSALRIKHAAIGLDDGSHNEIEWRILSGKSRFPEQLFLLSRAAEIFRECFDPIIAASGRDLIPVMVYGRNISGQEFSGMYCVVLIVKTVVVSAALIRIFGREAAELPLVATRRENQGKGYFQALFSCIERFLLSISVKRLVLPAADEAEPMWTKKLGFTKLSTEQMQKYTRDLQLTMFKGSSLLEKEVQLVAE